MALLEKPVTYHIKDIWEAYSLKLLATHSQWFSANPPEYDKVYTGVVNSSIAGKAINEKGKLTMVEMFNYKKFKEVVETFFELAKEEVVQGNALDMMHGIGVICARRIERNHKSRSVDFNKTKQQPKVWNEEKQRWMRSRIIYFTGDDYCRIGWQKMGKLKNETVYEFQITRKCPNGRGFDQQLSSALIKNPLLKYKYPFYPIKY